MSRAGGPNEIGKASFGLEADVEQLRADLQKAEGVAREGSEKVGQAVKDGMNAGSGGAGSGGNAPNKTPSTGGVSGASGGGGGSGPDWTALQLYIGTIEKAFSKGQELGNQLANMYTQMAELERARAMNIASIERSIQLVSKAMSNRTGGSPFTDPENVVQERINEIDAQYAKQLERSQAMTAGDLVSKGALYLTPPGLVARFGFGVKPEDEQAADIASELNRERTELAKTRDGVAQRNRSRYTVGGVLENELSNAGQAISGGRLPTGGALGPLDAAIFRELLQTNKEMRDILRNLSSGTVVDKQRKAAEMIGVPPGEVR